MIIEHFKLLSPIRQIYYLLLFIPREFKRYISKTEHEYRYLMGLSEKNTAIDLTQTMDNKNIISKCIETSTNILTYSSQILATNKKRPNSLREHLLARWQAIVIRPDKTYVVQEMLDDELGWVSDSWAFIGEDKYVDSGLWFLFKGKDTPHEKANQNMLLDNWVRLISLEEPSSLSYHSYKKSQYLLASYDPPSQSDRLTGTLFTTLIEDFKELCQIQVWIDTDTFLISKGVVQLEGYIDGEYGFSKTSIVFSRYNEQFYINPPEEFQVME